MEELLKLQIQRLEEELKTERERNAALISPILMNPETFLTSVVGMWKDDEDIEQVFKSLRAAGHSLMFVVEEFLDWGDDTPVGKLFEKAMEAGPDCLRDLEGVFPGVSKAIGESECLRILFKKKTKSSWMSHGTSRAKWMAENFEAGLMAGMWVKALADDEWEDWRDVHAEKARERGTGPGREDSGVDYEKARVLIELFGHYGWGAHGAWLAHAEPSEKEKKEMESTPLRGFYSPGFDPDSEKFAFGLSELVAETDMRMPGVLRVWESLGHMILNDKLADGERAIVIKEMESMPMDALSRLSCNLDIEFEEGPLRDFNSSFKGSLAQGLFLTGREDCSRVALRDEDCVEKMEKAIRSNLWHLFQRKEVDVQTWMEERLLKMESLKTNGGQSPRSRAKI